MVGWRTFRHRRWRWRSRSRPPTASTFGGVWTSAQFYGPKLELWTDLITEPGSATFAVDDTITNRGDNDQEFEMIYHSNYGPPLLEEGSTAVVAAERVVPFNANAAKGIAK